jgi:uncharacterized membrane protein (DUF373 family)
MDQFGDKRFLSIVHGYERLLAKLLAILLAVVIGFAVIELVVESSIKIARFQTNWFEGGLIQLLDRLLTAVARKVIVLPPGTESKPQLMAGFGVIVVGIAAAYWLVKQARHDQQSA